MPKIKFSEDLFEFEIITAAKPNRPDSDHKETAASLLDNPDLINLWDK